MGLRMGLKKELMNRKWPAGPSGEAYSRLPYVYEGRMFNRALGLQQDISEPIPPGECAITSLAVGPKGTVFGATSGIRSHLFRYSGTPPDDGICGLGVIEGARAVRRALVVADDGTVLGGVSETAGEEEGILFRYSRQEIELLPAPRHPACGVSLGMKAWWCRAAWRTLTGGCAFYAPSRLPQ